MRTVRRPTHREGAALSDGVLLERCVAELAETVPLVMRFLRHHMRAAVRPTVSVPQFRACVYLKRHPGASLAELADHLGVSASTASALVERLVRRGWVHRTEDARERRRVKLQLTPAGVRLLERAWRATEARLREVLADRSRADLVRLRRAMQVLREVFQVGPD